jgi:hypothetical protein
VHVDRLLSLSHRARLLKLDCFQPKKLQKLIVFFIEPQLARVHLSILAATFNLKSAIHCKREITKKDLYPPAVQNATNSFVIIDSNENQAMVS